MGKLSSSFANQATMALNQARYMFDMPQREIKISENIIVNILSKIND